MARPRKDIDVEGSWSVPTRFDRNDIEWIDQEMKERGYNSRAEVVRECVKFTRWSREFKRATKDEISSILADPAMADEFAQKVTSQVLKQIRDRLPQE
jgi:Arc/MetJ-type ribon-helix-helix transcriptional regulator